jgi:hypothetical protein
MDWLDGKKRYNEKKEQGLSHEDSFRETGEEMKDKTGNTSMIRDAFRGKKSDNEDEY